MAAGTEARSVTLVSSLVENPVDDGLSPTKAPWESVLVALVAERGDALTRFAFLVCGNREDAADLVQDALIKTFSRLRNGFTVDSAESYVRKGIVNTHFDAVRRAGRFRQSAHLNLDPVAQQSRSDEVDNRVDVAAALSVLAPRERVAVVLRYYEDLSIAQVANTMGLSAGAVKRYLSDSLAKLRARGIVTDGSGQRDDETGEHNV